MKSTKSRDRERRYERAELDDGILRADLRTDTASSTEKRLDLRFLLLHGDSRASSPQTELAADAHVYVDDEGRTVPSGEKNALPPRDDN